MTPLGKQWLSGSSRRMLVVWLLALASLAAPARLAANATGGIGVLGDSVSDEYRTDDDRGGTYRATTLGWTEQLVFRRGLNFGPYGEWGEPRRNGYAYNWARSGATASTLLSGGQHTGVAAQVAVGEVSHVLILIGGNDFGIGFGDYAEIYYGAIAGAALDTKIAQFVADVATAVETILSAGDAGIVLAAVGDSGLMPQAAILFPDAEKRQKVTDAITTVNLGLSALAALHGFAFVDTTAAFSTVVDAADENDILDVDGEPIDLMGVGDEPHNLSLSDAHPGTVFSGFMANLLLLDPIEAHYGLIVPRLSNQELLENAGIRSQPPPRIDAFSATPERIAPGTATTLTWQAQCALAAYIDGIGFAPVCSSAIVTPSVATTYTLIAVNSTGSGYASAQTHVAMGATSVWVDFDTTAAPQTGTELLPFDSIAQALSILLPGGTIHLKAGASSETTRIAMPARLEAAGGPVRVGAAEAVQDSEAQEETFADQEMPHAAAREQGAFRGFGVMGDSVSDEYRTNDYRGGDYSSTTLGWVEQLVFSRGLNFGAVAQRDEPRRTGFAYNWARSGATAASLLASGQHKGLAAQVAAGEVSHVFLDIGANDFGLGNGEYESIYSGALSDGEVQAKIARIVADITSAVETVRSAGDVRIALTTITDTNIAGAASILFPDPAGRRRVSDAIAATNLGIRALAEASSLTLVDTTAQILGLLADAIDGRYIDVGGEKIDFEATEDEPHHARLADGHPGTVFSGLMANLFFIDPLREAWGLDVASLSDAEILENAGIRPMPKPSLAFFSVEPTEIPVGGVATLRWSLSHALVCDIQPEVGEVHIVGSRQIAPSDETTYTLQAVATTIESLVTAQVHVLVVHAAPSIANQPQGRIFRVGEKVVLSVDATGEGTLTYQWRRNEVPLEGARAPLLDIESAQESDSGVYDCIVSNAAGPTPSASAELRLEGAPPTTSAANWRLY